MPNKCFIYNKHNTFLKKKKEIKEYIAKTPLPYRAVVG